MNEPLSLITLVRDASLLVQAVMVLLALMSFVSWIVIIEKFREVGRHFNMLRLFEEAFWSGQDIRALYRVCVGAADKTAVVRGVEAVFIAGFQAFDRGNDTEKDSELVLEDIRRNMRVVIDREEDEVSSRLPFLATVASVSPYIGLFGTVWGIMNSFRVLANVSQVSLASVAPGISEALVATAMGLLAAIPALIAYNRLSERVDKLLGCYQAFSEELDGILGAQLWNRSGTQKA